VSRSIGGFFQNLFYYHGTDSVVAVSEGVKKSLVEGRIPSKHIKVIHNGTPSDKYKGLKDLATEKLKLQFDIRDDDFVIGCVSRLKNQVQIVRALKYIPFKCKVIFVGIDRKEEFDNFLIENSLPHKLYYTEIVDGGEVLNYYPLFNVKVLASVQEGLSQAILESMAIGIPVIATDYAGNPELVNEGYNGMLFKDGDVKDLAGKILALKEDRDTRALIIKNGKETAFNEFSIDKTIKKYIAHFESLIK